MTASAAELHERIGKANLATQLGCLICSESPLRVILRSRRSSSEGPLFDEMQTFGFPLGDVNHLELAFRNLKRRPARSILTALGVALAVGSFITLYGLELSGGQRGRSAAPLG